MQQIPDTTNGCKPFGPLAKALVLNQINTAPDDHIRKERIMIAKDAGLLTDQEADDWIAILDLRAA